MVVGEVVVDRIVPITITKIVPLIIIIEIAGTVMIDDRVVVAVVVDVMRGAATIILVLQQHHQGNALDYN